MTQEREAFEAWALGPNAPLLPIEKYMNGEYKETATADAWETWQAARASLAQSASVPAGWKLVPVEPTHEMLAVSDIDKGVKIADPRAFASSLWSDMLAAAPAAPQPAQADMAPEYAAAVRELAEQSGMSGAQVLRAAVRLYQAEQKGLVTIEHKEQIGPLAAPQPEAQPQWQPIETAPKDSTSVLIYTPNSRKQVQEAWWAIQYEGSIDGYWSTPIGPAGRGYTILPEAATHWMPLPAAPSAQAEPRCKYCDGTGDVHDFAGEWRGSCTECKQAEQGGKQ